MTEQDRIYDLLGAQIVSVEAVADGLFVFNLAHGDTDVDAQIVFEPKQLKFIEACGSTDVTRGESVLAADSHAPADEAKVQGTGDDTAYCGIEEALRIVRERIEFGALERDHITANGALDFLAAALREVQAENERLREAVNLVRREVLLPEYIAVILGDALAPADEANGCPGFPNCRCIGKSQWATAEDPHGTFGAPGMMGG